MQPQYPQGYPQQYPQQQYPQQQYPQGYPQQQPQGYPQQQFPQGYPQQQQMHPVQQQMPMQQAQWKFDKSKCDKTVMKKYAMEIFAQCDRDRSNYLDSNEFWNAICMLFQKIGSPVPPQNLYLQVMQEYGYAERVQLKIQETYQKFMTIIKDMTGNMKPEKKLAKKDKKGKDKGKKDKGKKDKGKKDKGKKDK